VIIVRSSLFAINLYNFPNQLSAVIIVLLLLIIVTMEEWYDQAGTH
jgi:hypothetical protein